MTRKRYPIDGIITELPKAEVRISRCETIALAYKAIELAEQPYYCWRKRYNEVRMHRFLGYRPPPPES
jgi:hypothetical protein